MRLKIMAKQKKAEAPQEVAKPKKYTLKFTAAYEEHAKGSQITCGPVAAQHFIEAGVVETLNTK